MKRLITFGVFGATLLLLNGCDRYQSRTEAMRDCFKQKQGIYGSGTGCVEDAETQQFIYYEDHRVTKRYRW